MDSPRLAAKLRVDGFRSAPVIPAGKAAYTSRNGPTYVRFPSGSLPRLPGNGVPG
ncbi:hypothetical protein GCM10020229_36460 [Kitasatospora albolonga]